MKKIIFILSVLSIFISCDNKQKSIQSYMVNHQDEPGFMALDLPMSLIQLKAGEVPKDVKEAYESIKKINFVFIIFFLPLLVSRSLILDFFHTLAQ